MSNGKSGVVFTGAEMYLKTTFDSVKKIPFENIKSTSMILTEQSIIKEK